MQTESFGARLREQRERQQLTLAAIADQTKIKLSLLDGLERDDLSHWPEGIFRRSYIKTYAQAIGLAPDTVLREFLELHPEPVEVAPGEPVDRQSMRIRHLLDSAVGALSSIRQRYDRKPEPAAPEPEVPRDQEAAAGLELRGDTRPAVESSASPGEADAALRLDAQTLERDLAAFASLCTRLARVVDPRELTSVFEEAATIVNAVGLTLGVDGATGAVVVPLVRPGRCVGVLALELRDGGEQRQWVRALAGILAAQLATLVAAPAAAVEAVSA
jgi:transcriptional regulator with XRE-family HTH domain